MFVGRNFWKSSLLEFEKSEISVSSFNAVISLISAYGKTMFNPETKLSNKRVP